MDRQIRNKLVSIHQYRELAYSIKGAPEEQERVQSSPISYDKIGDSIAKLMEMEEECNALVDAYVDKRDKIIDELNEIEDEKQFEVLFMKFVERDKSFNDISRIIKKSARQTMRIYRQGLAEFEKKFGKNYLDA